MTERWNDWGKRHSSKPSVFAAAATVIGGGLAGMVVPPVGAAMIAAGAGLGSVAAVNDLNKNSDTPEAETEPAKPPRSELEKAPPTPS